MAATKNKKKQKGSEWSWRLAGVALCAFFGLGVATGLSGTGRLLSERAQFLLRLGSLIKRSSFSAVPPAPQVPRPTGNAIAMVKRTDGFYTLDAAGELRGPVSPTAAGDLPILSGTTIGNAGSDRLVGYASILVRAEAALGVEISEMRIDHNGVAVLYLDRPALPVTIALDHPDSEIAEAGRILTLWRGHLDLIAALDLTVPGQAVARLRPAAFEAIKRAAAAHLSPAAYGRSASHHPLPEVTASR